MRKYLWTAAASFVIGIMLQGCASLSTTTTQQGAQGAQAQPASTGARRIVHADTSQEILDAVAHAMPGDIIVIAPGVYPLNQALRLYRSGTPAAPITIRTQGLTGYATLHIVSPETVGVRVQSAYWVLDGLHIEGNNHVDDLIQVKGEKGGHNLTIKDCKISNCNEFLIKGSRSPTLETRDNVLVHNEWYDCGSNALDLDGGSRWLIRGNYVHDYALQHIPGVKDIFPGVYAIFLKGGVSHSIIEGNFVDGGNRPNTKGISFGAGLMGKQYMPKGWTGVEVTDSIMRNNIVVNVGLYAYHAHNVANDRYYNNIAYNTTRGFMKQNDIGAYSHGIALVNNLFSGPVSPVDYASHNLIGNDHIQWDQWFVDPQHGKFVLTPAGKTALKGRGVWVTGNPVDYFGNKRWKSEPQTLGPVLPDAPQASTVWVDSRAPANTVVQENTMNR